MSRRLLPYDPPRRNSFGNDPLVFLLALALVLAVAFGQCYLLAWAIVGIAWGFGVTIPFWPTFGAVALALFVVRLLHNSKE